VVVRNPNPSRWSASAMPVRIDVLDEAGSTVATESEFITLLPGQTGAVVGVIPGGKGAATVDATFEEGLRYWFTYDHVTGDLDFDRVQTRRGTSGPRTSGEVRSLFTDPQEGVQVVAVYRDKDGAILGGDSTYLRVLPVEGALPFEMDGVSTIPPRRIASTEVYYEQ
jgi:hypothetical protein